MVQFNFNERTIKAKVVYYGPAQSGKTTNLEQLHLLTDPTGINRLISLNTAQDRTLFFDLLPFTLGSVSGYDFQVQVYTVPGQVQYNATRRVVLAGADAVVFVADSRRSLFKENQAAFENMKVNLLANRLVPEKLPLVLQYNKQDLPDLLPAAELDAAVNPWGRPTFKAVATGGQGVLETFKTVVRDMLHAIAVKYTLKDKGLDAARVPELVDQAFAGVLKQAEAALQSQGGAPPAPSRIVVSQPAAAPAAAPVAAGGEAGLVSEELLHRAIRSNVDLAEALSGLLRELNVGLGEILSHAELMGIYRDDAREKRAGSLRTIQHEASRLRRLVQDVGAGMSDTVPGVGGAPPPGLDTAVSSAVSAAGAPSAPRPEAAGLEPVVRQALEAVKGLLESRRLAADLRIPPATELPRSSPAELQQALQGLLEGIATASPPNGSLSVRCEKKPVLIRTASGETKQDFHMIAITHPNAIPAADQQQILQGAAAGPLGEAARLVRGLGGFVRFAPLPSGGQETRVFIPSA